MVKRYIILLVCCTAAIAPFPTGLLLIDAPVAQTRFTVTGYDRQRAFGPGWAKGPGGCDSRQIAMAEAWAQPCAVPYSQWGAGGGVGGDGGGDGGVAPITDPYTNEDLLPNDVELDHLYPLSAAWDMGAHAWPQEKRLAFANDPLNLVVTSSRANQAKSDKLPSEWMPPARRNRCAYSQRLAQVAAKYELALPRADRTVMRRSCAGLRGLTSARVW